MHGSLVSEVRPVDCLAQLDGMLGNGKSYCCMRIDRCWGWVHAAGIESGQWNGRGIVLIGEGFLRV